MSFILDENRFNVIITKDGILKESELDLNFFISIKELNKLKIAIDKTVEYYQSKNITNGFIELDDKKKMNTFKKRRYEASELGRLIKKKSNEKNNLPIHLYLIGNKKFNTIKIGKSNDPHKRLKKLQTSTHFKLDLLFIIPHKADIERELHYRFNEFRLKGEWFKYDKSIIDHFDKLQQGI